MGIHLMPFLLVGATPQSPKFEDFQYSRYAPLSLGSHNHNGNNINNIMQSISGSVRQRMSFWFAMHTWQVFFLGVGIHRDLRFQERYQRESDKNIDSDMDHQYGACDKERRSRIR